MGDLEAKTFSKGMRWVIAQDDTVEPASSFAQRLSKWWNETILQSVLSKARQEEEEEEPNVLIVTHGGVIGTLVRNLLGSRKIRAAAGVVVVECKNASVTVIELHCGSGQGILTRYGDVAHLVDRDGLVETNVDELVTSN